MSGRRAVMLVRNGVSHDARVQRAAAVLDDLGYGVTIVGSQTDKQRAASERIGASDVVRVRARSPIGALRRVTGRGLPAPLAAAHRTLTALDWNRRALVHVLRARPALIHANDFNTMWTALAARRLTGARVLYDAHELWADRNGRREWRGWLVWAERQFIRRADATITASPGYSRALAERYAIDAPPVIRNITAQSVATREPAARSREVVYVGGLLPGRGLEPAIRALRHASAITLRLVGPGADPYVARLRAVAAEAGVGDRVVFDGAVDSDAVVASAASAGVGLCLIEPICRSYELTLPNKLFEYAAAGLPVLGSDMPVISEVVLGAGIGTTVAPDDERAVAAAMGELTEPERNAALRARAREFAARETWERESVRLADVYARLSATV